MLGSQDRSKRDFSHGSSDQGTVAAVDHKQLHVLLKEMSQGGTWAL